MAGLSADSAGAGAAAVPVVVGVTEGITRRGVGGMRRAARRRVWDVLAGPVVCITWELEISPIDIGRKCWRSGGGTERAWNSASSPTQLGADGPAYAKSC